MLRMHWAFCNLVLTLPPKFYEIVTSLRTSISSFLCQHIWSVKAPDTEHQYCRSLWHSLYSLPAPLLSTWLTPNSNLESLYHAHPDSASKITAHSVSMPSCSEGNPLLFRNNSQIGFSQPKPSMNLGSWRHTGGWPGHFWAWFQYRCIWDIIHSSEGLPALSWVYLLKLQQQKNSM